MQSGLQMPREPRPKNEADKSSLSINEFNRELMDRNAVLGGSRTKWIPVPSTSETTCLYLLSSENVGDQRD